MRLWKDKVIADKACGRDTEDPLDTGLDGSPYNRKDHTQSAILEGGEDMEC